MQNCVNIGTVPHDNQETRHYKCRPHTNLITELIKSPDKEDHPFPGQEALYKEMSTGFLEWYTTGNLYEQTATDIDPISYLINKVREANKDNKENLLSIRSVLATLYKVNTEDLQSVKKWTHQSVADRGLVDLLRRLWRAQAIVSRNAFMTAEVFDMLHNGNPGRISNKEPGVYTVEGKTPTKTS